MFLPLRAPRPREETAAAATDLSPYFKQPGPIPNACQFKPSLLTQHRLLPTAQLTQRIRSVPTATEIGVGQPPSFLPTQGVDQA